MNKKDEINSHIFIPKSILNRFAKIDEKNRGNKNNSYRETRTDKRAKWFKAAYKCLERRDALIKSKEEIKGGSGCQT